MSYYFQGMRGGFENDIVYLLISISRRKSFGSDLAGKIVPA
jgi:hypothetical protein